MGNNRVSLSEDNQFINRLTVVVACQEVPVRMDIGTLVEGPSGSCYANVFRNHNEATIELS